MQSIQQSRGGIMTNIEINPSNNPSKTSYKDLERGDWFLWDENLDIPRIKTNNGHIDLEGHRNEHQHYTDEKVIKLSKVTITYEVK